MQQVHHKLKVKVAIEVITEAAMVMDSPKQTTVNQEYSDNITTPTHTQMMKMNRRKVRRNILVVDLEI